MAGLSKAQERALRKALRRAPRGVMAAGGFGGRPPDDPIGNGDFDRRAVIERLCQRRLLWPAEGANSYAATEDGWAAIEALDRRRAARR